MKCNDVLLLSNFYLWARFTALPAWYDWKAQEIDKLFYSRLCVLQLNLNRWLRIIYRPADDVLCRIILMFKNTDGLKLLVGLNRETVTFLNN